MPFNCMLGGSCGLKAGEAENESWGSVHLGCGFTYWIIKCRELRSSGVGGEKANKPEAQEKAYSSMYSLCSPASILCLSHTVNKWDKHSGLGVYSTSFADTFYFFQTRSLNTSLAFSCFLRAGRSVSHWLSVQHTLLLTELLGTGHYKDSSPKI